MTVGWLIDAGVFDSYHDELAAAITRNGHEVASINRPNPPYEWDDVRSSYRNAFSEGACVVAHADIDLISRVIEDNLWTPGAFATVPHFYCSHYYARLGRFLLNRDYIMLPYAELPRCRDFVFDTLGVDDRLFVRPDSPLKIFTGLTISRETFSKDFEFMGFYEFPSESMVVVSSPKQIVAEWRYVVAKGEVVAGSKYIDAGEEVSLEAEDPLALEFAQAVAAEGYEPDPVWVLDVCRTVDGGYHLVEIGGFSFASIYGCDKDAVV
ncbi:MAG: ATP-grasp domain-containing protein, partial [Planctomycetota bacterium]